MAVPWLRLALTLSMLSFASPVYSYMHVSTTSASMVHV